MPYEKIFSPLSFPSRDAMVQEILSVYNPQTFQ